ncbi:Zn-ribbon domain-containing OB-fold protein [Gordonia hydrophobica]|uniref:OB-fold domain-containing protein n=1 Tax=Gordonia hydrophobica TaxID=40516 RepID=A0ABZ2U0L0_9ACTN|nr:OB-fold domain-containing protein [Gordonia hydrophobica]MBM7369251.1 putative OB-fold protein [Gordonia hydrophobica]
MNRDQVAALPVPAISIDSLEFWKSGSDGQLRITRCDDCQLWIYPPKPICRRCRSQAVSYEPVQGRGRIFSYTISRQQFLPGVSDPYAIAVVTLDEDPDLRMTARVVADDLTRLHIGMPVTIEFEERNDMWIPVVAPTGEEDPQ